MNRHAPNVPATEMSFADRMKDRRVILLVVGLAAALRLPTVFVEMIHHPDELWQYLEPAYRMVRGLAIVPWEFRYGMRSLALPTLLAGPMWVGKLLSPFGIAYLWPVRLLLATLSLSIVGFGTAIALRVSRFHALVAGVVLATSFELIYFAARALTETVSAALFIPAIWLLTKARATSRDRILAGFLLGLCFCVRFQLTPALATAALLYCGVRAAPWIRLLIGAAASLFVSMTIDIAHGAPPFGWVWANFNANLIQNRSAFFGVEPPLWYLAEQIRVWGYAFPVIMILAVVGARRWPGFLLITLVNFAVHALIPHKEYRFVFLSVVLLLLLAGIGAADTILWLAGRYPNGRKWQLAAAVALLFGCSAAVAFSPGGEDQWNSSRRLIGFLRKAHHQAHACGFAFYQPPGPLSAAYVYYDRATPIYVLSGEQASQDLHRYGRGFNIVATSPDRAWQLGPAYHPLGCANRLKQGGTLPPLPSRCLFARKGGCHATMPERLEMNQALQREDK